MEVLTDVGCMSLWGIPTPPKTKNFTRYSTSIWSGSLLQSWITWLGHCPYRMKNYVMACERPLGSSHRLQFPAHHTEEAPREPESAGCWLGGSFRPFWEPLATIYVVVHQMSKLEYSTTTHEDPMLWTLNIEQASRNLSIRTVSWSMCGGKSTCPKFSSKSGKGIDGPQRPFGTKVINRLTKPLHCFRFKAETPWCLLSRSHSCHISCRLHMLSPPW